jgi:hypothetical protein
MPRDGSGVYTQPFPDVVEGTTIESAVYNGFVADVSLSQHAAPALRHWSREPRAVINLGGEWRRWSTITTPSVHRRFFHRWRATAAPVTGHAFAICYMTDSADMFLEATDQDDGAAGAQMDPAEEGNVGRRATSELPRQALRRRPTSPTTLWFDTDSGKTHLPQ